MNEVFRKFAHKISEVVGTSGTFIAALSAIVIWLLFGPYFQYSDTWQLVTNTATTIVTFLMVFVIQNTQNRDAKAIHLKLDELIRSRALAIVWWTSKISEMINWHASSRSSNACAKVQAGMKHW